MYVVGTDGGRGGATGGAGGTAKGADLGSVVLYCSISAYPGGEVSEISSYAAEEDAFTD